ncbi:diaminopimelate epimerase [Helicobacter sp. 16-1353]|uniref:diaminopimelate epimerase n=1 Tax=Helicobacter sp. 16-1353 TaxID=2004996 RepID=UPI000DCC56E8|nr:diaminopimelate epimerase [Helicobacter sp. 16-1353]RAX52272.1 diaminopimelate epimerase [Helicobacter sp. 16-1353]
MWLSKYSASGNDFLIFHTFKKDDYSKLAKKLCNRHNGIGADGLVALLPHTKYAYEWDFYNSDGSNAEMCGNASRCVAHYAYKNQLAPKKHSFLAKAGEIKVEVNGLVVEVNFGKIKMLDKNIIENNLHFYLLDSGVPHLVAFINEKSNLPKNKNDFLQNLRQKYNANVNLAYIKNKNKIHLATYERGVEEITLACGSGMAATFYLALSNKKIKNDCILIPPSGDKLHFRTEKNDVYFKGAVQKIGDVII